MKETFRKNLLFVLLAFIILIFSSGCGLFKAMFTTEVITYENSFTLTYDSDLKEYLPYDEKDIPTFTFYFDGSINLTKNRTGEFECCFYNNDDFKISGIVSDILKKYEELNRVTYYTVNSKKTDKTYLNKLVNGKQERVTIKCKDGLIYNKMAYVSLENGLELTMNYCEIIDEDNFTYYRWSDSDSIRFVLHYPLMVRKINGEKKIVFLAIPNQVTLRYDTTTKLPKQIYDNDKFMDEEWYTYSYTTDYNTDYLNFKNYYIDNFNGRMIDDKFVYTFLGYDFEVVFNTDNFIIKPY